MSPRQKRDIVALLRGTLNMAKPYLTIVIPAYNEAKRIPLTLLDIDRKLQGKEWSYEILVVDNGSKDQTVEIVRRMAGTIRGLKAVESPIQHSKGAAVRHGMLLGQGTYRLFMDADNATSIDHFDRMVPHFKAGYGVVICSRALKESKMDPAQPIYRQIPGKIGNLIIQLLVLPGIWDTQCGFKAFTAETAEQIFRLSRIDGWGFDVEILALAKRFGYRIKEVPVHWVNSLESTVGVSAYITTLLDTLKIRWWLWLNSYQIPKTHQIAEETDSTGTE